MYVSYSVRSAPLWVTEFASMTFPSKDTICETEMNQKRSTRIRLRTVCVGSGELSALRA